MQNPVNSITVNDIVRRYWDRYRERFRVSDHERNIFSHIMACRTEEMGSRVQRCDSCDYTLTLYNSCRDRNCPSCQSMKKELWILERKEELLPFQYFHVVFTLPDRLDPIVVRNKEKIYALLFAKVKETLLSAAGEKKYFGAKIGFFAILHTWGRNSTFIRISIAWCPEADTTRARRNGSDARKASSSVSKCLPIGSGRCS